MNVPAKTSSRVRCREIVEADIEAVAALLTRGFVGRPHDYWMRGLHRQSTRDVPANYPRFGYLLEHDGLPVGALLLVYGARHDTAEPNIRCNLSSWYVEPEFRNYASLLTSMAQKNKHVTYFNVSPAENTWPIIEAQGFKRHCRGLFFAMPFVSGGESGQKVMAVTPQTAAIDGLPQDDLDRLKSHAEYGCTSLVCITADGPLPFILMPFRIRRGRLPTPAMQLIYCRDPADFVRCAKTIGGFLLLRGRPIVILNANAPIAGLVGVYTEKRGRKYVRGPHPPSLIDMTETELVLFGP